MTEAAVELDGYKEGETYKKEMKQTFCFGNSNSRYVVFKDENGIELTWKTTDYTKGYSTLLLRANYSFRVDYIYLGKIHISHVKRLPKGEL